MGIRSPLFTAVVFASALAACAPRINSHGNLPDPDLLIRCSGEMRLSNFLPWQMVYTEIYFTPVFWPDFRRHHLYGAVREFQQRQRRFGA